MIIEYLILGSLTFLGAIIGILLGIIAPEELEPGIPWFIKLQDTIFTILIIILIYFNLNNLVIIPLILFLIFYWYKENIGKNQEILEYVMLGIIFSLGYLEKMFVIISSLIFIYLIASSSLLKFEIKNINNLIKKIIHRFIYYFIGLIIPFLFLYV